MKTKAKFPGSSSKNCFYSDVRQKVNLHFSSNNIGTHANAAMWFKTILFLTTGLIIYLIILLVPLNLWLLAVLVISLGACCAFIGFNICHDAIHGSFSKHKEVNKMFSFVFNLVGANPYVWNITHNIVHHTYTNIPGHDEDIEVAPGLIRISENDELKKYQRYQQFYAFALYSLASLSWVLRKDYKKFFQSHVGMHENKHPPKEYFKLFFYKALYYFLFIGLPILIMSVAWWQVIIGFILLHMAQGLTMGLVFQLAHVVNGTIFPSPDNKGNMEEAWAEHQMRTTANFAADSKLASFFLGGLNRQIEHHLFPRICHIHYGKISEIVKETALLHGMPYHENGSFTDALQSHFLVLKKLGSEK